MADGPVRPARLTVPTFAVVGVGVAVLASPLRLLWCRSGQPWWLVFAVWAAVVALEGIAVSTWTKAGDD